MKAAHIKVDPLGGAGPLPGMVQIRQPEQPVSIQMVHVSDIHFGSGETHGRINPLTGLNVRFEDFVEALEKNSRLLD